MRAVRRERPLHAQAGEQSEPLCMWSISYKPCAVLLHPEAAAPHRWRQADLSEEPDYLITPFATPQMVARSKEDILAARGVKPTLSPNLSVRSRAGWGWFDAAAVPQYQ